MQLFGDKKRCLVLVSVLLLIAIPLAGAVAAEYPKKPVKVIVPWAPGGSTDTGMRAFLTVMGSYFPQPMVVVNKPGGAGTVGTTQALLAKPDGYTILFTAWGPLVTQPALKDLQYSEKDYIAVIQVAAFPRIISAHPDRPYNNLKEMMEFAKMNPEKVRIGVSGIGTTGHLAMVQLEQDYGVKLTIVPMGGGGPQKTALIGGHVDVAPLNAPEAGPPIAAKQIKPLGVADTKRLADFPDVPTCAELGYPIESGVSSVVVVPAGTPPEIVKAIHDAFKSAMEDPALQTFMKKINMDLEYLGPEETAAKLAKFRTLYAKIIGKLGLKKK